MRVRMVQWTPERQRKVARTNCGAGGTVQRGGMGFFRYDCQTKRSIIHAAAGPGGLHVR